MSPEISIGLCGDFDTLNKINLYKILKKSTTFSSSVPA